MPGSVQGRALGTILDPKGKAIVNINKGEAFYGEVDILGKPYVTGYDPIKDASGKVIGIWYVGYKKSEFSTLVGTVGLLRKPCQRQALASTNKSLAQMDKSRDAVRATKRYRLWGQDNTSNFSHSDT